MMEKLFSWDDIKTLLPDFKPKKTAAGLFGIHLQPTGISIAYMLRDEKQLPILQWCQSIPTKQIDNLTDILAPIVSKQQLANCACNLVLSPSDYKLAVTDNLPVKAEELKNAVRWQVKDLIDFPVGEAAIDVFPIPNASVLKKEPQLQVVVTRLARLKTLNDQINASGLTLTSIDITELALRNITALFPEDKQGIGLIWIKPDNCSLLITQNNTIYFNRNFNPNFGAIANIADDETLTETHQRLLEDVGLEIQRSLDYYQSQLRQPPLARLFMTSSQLAVLDYLSTRLTNKVESFNLNSVLNCKQNPANLLQKQCLAAIGGALRTEQTHATTAG